MDQQKQHHIDLKPGDVGRYVLLPGDPGRTEVIASYFDDAKEIAYKREYRTFTGTLLGEKVSVTSTGIGCPSAAIAIEELIALGADTFIRVGTSGGIQPDTINGEVAIVSGAIRDEGTTLHYMPAEFPAVADLDITLALRKAAQDLGQPYRVGISQSKDSFYGQHAPKRMPVANRLLDRWKAWTDGGAICSEMEAAVLFVIGSIHRVRVGGVMMMAKFEKHPETPEEIEEFAKALDINKPIRVAVEALKTLIEADRAKA
ncbi:MAG: nucleoside phosphorylase [Anaerolineales bacterium]|nr:nucleoside phosphorylase [Anaerolineales bacterium]MCW5854841.1 nucleoside phosphorylase [Anaerolineales bacterium]